MTENKRNSKFQAPNSKEIPMSEMQNKRKVKSAKGKSEKDIHWKL